MLSKLHFLGVLLAVFIQFTGMTLMNTKTGGLPSAPIVIKSVDVTSSLQKCTNVSVTFVAMENVQVVWTVREGFLPKDMNDRTTRNDFPTHREKHSSVCLPTDLDIQLLKLHLICEKHSFELHISLQVSHNMTNIHEDVKQYTLLVPKSTEIGISSRGEARFHIMVDTSGTNFLFGLLQTEVALLYGAIAQQDSAFSFLPDDKSKIIRLQRNVQTESEYHSDAVIKSFNLQRSKTKISVSAACTQPHSVISRLDMKYVIYLKRSADIPFGNKHPVAILGEQNHELVKVREQGNALLRCSAVGFPRPGVSLYKKDGNTIFPRLLPSYTTTLEHERTKVLQILNATMSDAGLYICKASNTMSSAEKTFMVNIQ